jgi:hypothetical protein
MRTFGPEAFPESSQDQFHETSSYPFQDPFHNTQSFSLHIQTCWGFYALEQPQPEDDQYVTLLKKFLGSPNKSSAFYIRWLHHIKKYGLLVQLPFRAGPHLSPEDLTPATTPMFTIAQFSLYEGTLRKWCDNNDFDPFQQNDTGENLLTIAAMTNCIPLCATLIAKGVSVNQCSASGRYGSALAAAATGGLVVGYRKEDAVAVRHILKLPSDQGIGDEH